MKTPSSTVGDAIPVSNETVEALRAWFGSYVAGFRPETAIDRTNLQMKADHSRCVEEEMNHLSVDLGLDTCGQRLASTIGLLHDVGRFEQYMTYRTFSDHRSVNHAELGVAILDREDALHALSAEGRNVVRKAILYHNRPALPEEESASVLLFARMIRDADKLDILRFCIKEYARTDGKRNEAVGIDLPDTPGVSADVVDDIAHGRAVHPRDLRNLNDFKLFQLGWVFDINFAPTFRRMHSRGYVEQIRDTIRDGRDAEHAIEAIRQHVQKGIDER